MLDLQINDARKLIIETGNILAQKKLIVGSWGNISMKIEKDTFAITPSGRDYDSLVPDDIVITNSEGKKLTGNRTPSTETKLHMAIYKANSKIKAIVHTHSIYVCAVAAMHKSIPVLVDDIAHINGGLINVAEYGLSGTDELAQNAVKALGNGHAVLLANHGAVCCGKTLKAALIVAELVEKAAQIYCITASMGGGYPLDEKNIKVIKEFYNSHYSKRQAGTED